MNITQRAIPSLSVNLADRLSAKVVLCLVLSLAFFYQAGAQEKAPERGFRPSGSYALSDIETISTTSGNMMLRVPLASLPPGRGGLSASLSLIYNSKLYDSFPSSVYINHSYYDVTNLKKSQAGGWRYGFKYELYGEGRYGGVDEMGEINPCSFTSYIAKLALLTPDGGKHELRLTGHTDGDGFHNVWQDGRPACSGGTGDNGTLNYYTTDGTFLRLTVEHDSDTNMLNNPWTLYLPDGGRVTGGNANQRIYDRNNNFIEIVETTYNGHSATYLTDQVGRSIIIEYESATNQDKIHTVGYNGAALATTIAWTNVQVYKAYSREVGAPFNLPATWRSVSQITLPSQAASLTYIFGYNANGSNPTVGWGELNSITLPSGAKSTYTYANDNQNNLSVDAVLNNRPTQKLLVYRPEYDGASISNTACNTGSEICISEATSYGMTYVNDGEGSVGISSTITGPDGGVTTAHFNKNEDGTINREGLVYKSVSPDGTVTERYWQPNIPYTNSLYIFNQTFYPKFEFTSIPNPSGTPTLTAIKEYNYDKNGNVTRVASYDWVPYGDVPRNSQGRPYAAPYGVLPKTVVVNTYYNPTPDASDSTTNDPDSFQMVGSPRLHRLLESTEVQDGSANAFSRSEIFYDNTNATGVVSYPIGNPTQQKTWDSTKGSLSRPLGTGNIVSSSTQYDPYGNPTLTTDARGVTTSYCYSTGDCTVPGQTANLYPTRIRVAANYSSLTRTTTREYDFNTGLAKLVTDVENNVSTKTTYDALGRPTLVEVADGKSEETQTVTDYSDTYRRVIVRSDLNNVGDGKLVSIQHYDQLGRVRLSRQLENAATESETDETAGIKVQTRYLISGSYTYQISSNPYRTTSEATMGWTRTKADIGGRTIEVQTFGGGSLPAPWGSNSTSTGTVTSAYDVQFTTVTDQAGKVRRSMTNGLGQLARVDEPNSSGSLGETTNPNQPTSYTYSALSNLVKVTQGTQYRYFMYDSLSRLRRASNPEQTNNSNLSLSDSVTGNSQWSVAYQYDDNGNLLVKTEARDVSTHLSYDQLNRIVRRWYNGSSSLTATTHNSPSLPSGIGTSDEANYFYDSQTLPSGAPTYTHGSTSGRLVAVTYGAGSTGDYFAYDVLGRSMLKIQQTGGINYQIQRTFNRASSVTGQTYPSGRTTGYTRDTAGRTASFSGNLGDGTNRTYATVNLYSPWGGLEREQFGTDTPLYHKQRYTNRGQLWDMRLSTVNDVENWNRGAIVNYYSLSNFGGGGTGTDTNGNLYVQQNWIPHNDQISAYTVHQQNYAYDELNRLSWVGEYLNGATATGAQSFLYDRWGNRRIDPASWGTGINNKQFAVSTANNNRLEVPSGQSGTMSYDNAGNLTNDTYTGAGSRVYDAENRMTKAWGGNNQWQEYFYNADGHRVRRKIDGMETWQVYGMEGELLAEYPLNGAPTSPQKEYGYRNGQLLITAANTQGCGAGYTGTKTWTATSPSLGHATGQQEGSNWAVYVGSHSPNAMVFGPYDNTFGQGHHSAQFWLMVDNTSGTDVVATVDVVTGYGSNILAQRQIRRNEFTGANQWQVFTLEFNNPCFGLVESRVWWSGTVNMKFSQVTITATSTSALDLEWLVTDHLGTPRMVVNKTGSLAGVKRHDYLPFGEELYAGVSSRTVEHGYTGDGVRQKLTSKERDNETGLDYFLARYYASTQGRFTSTDPMMASAKLSNPQTMNRYVYVINNPLRYIDPNGLDAEDPWSSLTKEEQLLLASKLTTVKDGYVPTKEQLAAAGAAFNEKVKAVTKNGLDVKQTMINVASVKAFVAQLGSNKQAWAQVDKIDQVQAQGAGEVAVITFTVKNHDAFMGALKADPSYRYREKDVNHIDSFRLRTVSADDPSFHIVRDGGTFGSHWDPTSFFNLQSQQEVVNGVFSSNPMSIASGAAGMAIAGLRHYGGKATVEQVQKFLTPSKQ